MTSEDAYIKFLQKVNKNYTNDNISVDRSRFVFLYNESQNKFIEWILEKRNEDEIRYIQKLLIYDKRLKLKQKVLNHQDFNLPKDFFSFSNIQSFATNNNCKSVKLLLHEIKQENREELLEDEFNKPSFKFRETFYSFGEDAVRIYTDNFDIDKTFLTYYRYPKQIDVKGYIKTDNTNSVDINPEFDDKVVDRILTTCAKEFDVNNENLQKVQFEKDRIITKV